MIDAGLRARIATFIESVGDGKRDDAARDALLTELSEQQAQSVAGYQRFLRSETRRPGGRLPALPTDVFRYARVAGHAPEHDVRVFRTSGTSSAERGSHAFADLSLYDLAAERAARHALFPDRERMRLLVLAPHESDTPDSSLSYMLSRFAQWFGLAETRYFVSHGELQSQALLTALHDAAVRGAPIALLGTSFAFVHAEDAFGAERFELLPGSRIMQTGGFKGRSRSVEPEAMLELLSQRYGVKREWIVQEYGMTELSSQLYETTLRQAALGRPVQPRRLWTPSWVRAEPIDPQSLLPVAQGEVGVLRIDDLANVGSVCAIQTSDLARRLDDGIVVLGRAPGAVARGCSLTFDQWMAAAAERGSLERP
jgi:Acyl-protein synthetase, LuxE